MNSSPQRLNQKVPLLRSCEVETWLATHKNTTSSPVVISYHVSLHVGSKLVAFVEPKCRWYPSIEDFGYRLKQLRCLFLLQWCTHCQINSTRGTIVKTPILERNEHWRRTNRNKDCTERMQRLLSKGLVLNAKTEKKWLTYILEGKVIECMTMNMIATCNEIQKWHEQP